eukprot:NODE_1955_length_1325_cov_24.953255_g1858_i0.p1 GENE.NODE_1955_length_1325_cov_24.953255_g1858_i0~~NODE_1955_length_1325_cov_24.953255_g1858_i0.p1  ORF type:complete len:424 (+),score=116.88 NODE_1955_length_1325_cov_24.953255_g1858_i0:38-1273(+)
MLWCVLCFVALADAKVTSGMLRLSTKEPFAILDRFAYAIGDGEFTASLFHPKGSPYSGPGHLLLVLDEDWDAFTRETSCAQKINLARAPLEVTGEPLSSVVRQSIRAHVWYAVFINCRVAEGEGSRRRLAFRATFTNPNGNHFGADEEGLLVTYYLVMSGLFLFDAFYLARFLKLRAVLGGTHPALWILTAACLALTAACVLECCHLLMFSRNGTGLPACDLMAEILTWLFQLILSFLLMFLGWGWTITQTKAVVSNVVFYHLDIWLLILMVAMLQISLVLIGRFFADTHDKFHDHESWPGFALVGISFGQLLIFISGIRSTKTSAHSNINRRIFMARLATCGTIWFCSLPLIVLLAALCPPYYRHRVVSLGTLLTNVLGVTLLAKQFVTRGEYFRLSTLSKNLLPGAKTI